MRVTPEFAAWVERQDTRGTRIQSAEGSAVGKTASEVADAKRLAQEGARRAARLPRGMR